MKATMRLGLTMAGAVSAGAYTAGVVDYLIEALLEWEKAKSSPDNKDIPPHQVKIDVIGGTSAGGIAAAIMALMLRRKGIESLESFKKSNSMLYRTWVELVDDGNQDNSFLKIITSDDIGRDKDVLSLLNSDFMAELEERALVDYEESKAPSFVSEDFEVLLTLSNLRGIPAEVDFNSDQGHRKEHPTHSMRYHKMYGHFKTAKAQDGDDYLKLDPTKEVDNRRLFDFAKGTSAFPLGFKNRQFSELPYGFVLKTIKKFIHPEIVKSNLMNFKEDLPSPFEFTALDGGIFNNEPFMEIERLLKARKPEAVDAAMDDYAMIMIDPFPSFQETDASEYEQPRLIHKSFLALFGALRNQAMMKEADMLSLSKAKFKRNMVFPVRYENKKKVPGNAIACGALGGFSGFLSRSFREHDYKLGRDNCLNFLQYIFTIRYEKKDGIFDRSKFHPIHQEWTDKMIEIWGNNQRDALYLPIIPDMEKLKIEHKPYNVHEFNFPSIPAARITGFSDLIAARALTIIDMMEKNSERPSPTKDPLEKRVSQYVENMFKPNGITKFFSDTGVWLFKGRIKKSMAEMAAKQALHWMLIDLSKKQLITDFNEDSQI